MKLKVEPEEAVQKLEQLINLGHAVLVTIKMGGRAAQSRALIYDEFIWGNYNEKENWIKECMNVLRGIFFGKSIENKFFHIGDDPIEIVNILNNVGRVETFGLVDDSNFQEILIGLIKKQIEYLIEISKEVEDLIKFEEVRNGYNDKDKANDDLVLVFNGDVVFNENKPSIKVKVRDGFPRKLLFALHESNNREAIPRRIDEKYNSDKLKGLQKNWADRFGVTVQTIKKILKFDRGSIKASKRLKFEFEGL